MMTNIRTNIKSPEGGFRELLLFVLFTILLHAEVKLPAVFCNHMVLQRGVEIPVWGKASPNE